MPHDLPLIPLTWGQKAILGTIGDLGGQGRYFTIRRVIPLPTGDDDLARRMLWRFAETNESLRTVISEAGEPLTTQRIISPERIRVDIATPVDAGDQAEHARAAAARLAREPFDLTAEPPIRCSVIRAPGNDALLALAVSHFAVDAYALSLLSRWLSSPGGLDALTDRPPWQPRMQAAAEGASSSGRRTERAITRWTTVLADTPVVASPPAPERADRFVEWSLESATASDAIGATAERTETSPASVVLAIWCLALGLLDGRSTVALTLISGNRHRDRERHYLGPMAQDTPMSVELRTGTFDDLVREVHREALNAYADGRYDPALLAAAMGAPERTVRPPGKILTFFNDARSEHPSDQPGRPPAGLRRIGHWARLDLRRFLVLQQIGRTFRLRLLADTEVLTADRIPALLQAMAEALVCAASGARVGDLEHLLGRQL
ncbi:condensation domain-containing protein [Symbioplanes lichenis]|uniref:condensation domain-containing protein n=1 Tax=Symbioplanes lichenis TaxID=1629072 RepID=UPI00273A2D39|nr:condensation domain-containing protein [Actinoplanes lichenis]